MGGWWGRGVGEGGWGLGGGVGGKHLPGEGLHIRPAIQQYESNVMLEGNLNFNIILIRH